MKLAEIIKNFNLQMEEFLDVIESIHNDDNIKKARLMVKTLNKINATKIIEQFIINIIPYSEKIYNKDEHYILNLDTDEIRDKLTNIKVKNTTQEEKILEVMKLKNLWLNLDTNDKEAIWEYLQLLTYYSQEYLKIKLEK
jgi:hypothetical protein